MCLGVADIIFQNSSSTECKNPSIKRFIFFVVVLVVFYVYFLVALFSASDTCDNYEVAYMHTVFKSNHCIIFYYCC